MPTPLFEFNSAENFDTAWIFVTNFSTRDGQDNIQVPAYLSTQASTIGTWSLVVGGTVLTTNQDFSSLGYDPEFGIAGGGKYTVGEKQQNRPYRNTIDNSTTETVTVIGEYIGGPTGTGIYDHIHATAWVVFDQTGPDPWCQLLWDGAIVFFGRLTQYNDFDNPGVTQPFGSVTYDETTNTALNVYSSYYEGVGTNEYTRGQKVANGTIGSTGSLSDVWRTTEAQAQGSPQSGNLSIYKIAKKSIDTYETKIIPSTINQDTNYEFYEVIWTTSSEVNNYIASACLVLPVHILQRSISQRSTAMKINGLDLGESYVRVASDMASGLTEVKDLYDNYGIEAQAIPIILTIGGNAISIGINQIADIAINNNQDKHILRYDETTEKWQNILAADVTFTGSYFDLVDAPEVPSIENMDDTEISNTLADDNVLKWDDGLQKWVNAPETNDLSSAVTWTDIPDLHITESAVIQHQSAISITESQISDLQHYTDISVNTHLNIDTATTGQILSWDGSDYSWTNTFDGAFSSLTGTPTTLAGYGITDGNTGGSGTGGSGYPWGAGGTNDYEINGGPPIYIINGGSPTTTDINELDGGTI